MFDIAHVGLKTGEHLYEYDIDNSFLEEMGYIGEEMKDLQCKVNLKFEKLTNLFQLKFDLDGKATVACDRCGDDMELKVWDEYDLIIKISFDESLQEAFEDDGVLFIPKHESIIDLSSYVYEFLLLSIPIQHVHGEDEEGNSLCNQEVLKKLNQYKAEQEEKEHNERKNIWKGLDNFKDNN